MNTIIFRTNNIVRSADVCPIVVEEIDKLIDIKIYRWEAEVSLGIIQTGVQSVHIWEGSERLSLVMLGLITLGCILSVFYARIQHYL